MPGPRITGLEARPKEPDLDIEARGDGICLVGGSIWGKIRHLGCGGDNAFLRRAEARGDQARQRQRRGMRIMVPWPAVG
jgi:hypothetical protein